MDVTAFQFVQVSFKELEFMAEREIRTLDRLLTYTRVPGVVSNLF